MPPVVSKLLAACLCVALPIGALCAPFLHAHLDDHHGDHHEAARVHAHLGGHEAQRHAASQAELAIGSGSEPEDVTRLQVFVAVHPVVPASPALSPARYTLPAPLESIMRRPLTVVHSHGPPSSW